MIRAQRAGWKVAGLVAAVGLLGGACRTDREITRPDPVPITEEGLTGVLLTADDVPSGFKAADEGTPINAEMVPEHGCDDPLKKLDPKETVTTDFSNGKDRLSSTVAWFPGQGSAVEQVYRGVADDCAAVVASDAGLSLRTGRLDFGVLSKDTLALAFELEPESGPIEERDLIVIRNGDLVSTVRLSGPRPSDKVLLDQVVRIEIGRLGHLADAAAGR